MAYNNLVANRTYGFTKVLLGGGRGQKKPEARPDRGRFHFYPVGALATANRLAVPATVTDLVCRPFAGFRR